MKCLEMSQLERDYENVEPQLRCVSAPFIRSKKVPVPQSQHYQWFLESVKAQCEILHIRKFTELASYEWATET